MAMADDGGIDDGMRSRLLVAVQRSGAFFAAAGLVHGAAHAVAKAVVPARMAALKPNDRIAVGQLAASLAHGLASGGMGLYLVGAGTWSGDVFGPYPELCDTLFACLSGYAVWDTMVMLWQKDGPDMWLHHVLVMFGAFAMQVYREAAFFPALFAISELTVVPNNLLWYARSFAGAGSGDASSAVLRVVRAAFYVVFRLPLGPYALAHAISTSGGVGPLVRRFAKLPVVVSGGTALNVGALTILNVIWTLGAVRSARRGAKRMAKTS